jgi:hypothetical protein
MVVLWVAQTALEAGGVGRDPPARGIRAPDRNLAREEVVGVSLPKEIAWLHEGSAGKALLQPPRGK